MESKITMEKRQLIILILLCHFRYDVIHDSPFPKPVVDPIHYCQTQIDKKELLNGDSL